MAQYNKLSIEFLAKSFEEAEGMERSVFAVLASEETIRTVRGFLSSVHRGEGGNLFNKPFVLDESMEDGQIFLATKPFGMAPTLEEFSNLRTHGDLVYLS